MKEKLGVKSLKRGITIVTLVITLTVLYDYTREYSKIGSFLPFK